jgi:thioesterase domain-containing protein
VKTFGAVDLQALLDTQIPLAKALQVRAVAAGDAAVVLAAPLAPNANHAGTAFGGSLYSLAVLAAWGWLTRALALATLEASVVIQEGRIRYHSPVLSEFTATCFAPHAAAWQRFHTALQRRGIARLELRCELHSQTEPAAELVGQFVAQARKPPGNT